MSKCCLNCLERCVGCHINCDKYLQFKQERQMIKDNRLSYYNSKALTADVKKNIANKIKRRK